MTISLALAEPPAAAPLAIGAVCSLPALIDRARSRLAEARTSAEVLEARAAAKAALHYAKLLEAANETQADCLSMIKRAELRMADEIDAAQQRGEVARADAHGRGIQSSVRGADTRPATYEELGLTRQRVAEWRELRDAGESVIDDAIQAALDEGRAPTNADVQRAVEARHHRTRFTGENEWYTPAEYIEAVRACLGAIDVDPASSARAQESVRASRFFTRDNDGLRHDWHGRIWLNPPYSQPDIARFVDKLLAEIGAGRVRQTKTNSSEMQQRRRDHEAEPVSHPGGIFGHLRAVRMTVKYREEADDRHGDRHRCLDTKRHTSPQHDHRERDTDLDERDADAGDAEHTPDRHHQDEGNRHQP